MTQPIGGLLPGEIIVDSFAGGGGASQGILMALGRSPDVAINHDWEAIALHQANHPDSLHLAEDVWKVDPVTVCASRPVGLMWLSPDCKHFSKAKGGKPVSKKIRGLAWVAIRWAAAVRPRVIVLENVEEFQTWGPVLRDSGMPCKERRGQTFRAFVNRLRKLGYVVEWKELRACDYGAPTIRKRLFLVARCDGEAITWPPPTHGKGRAHPWRTAAECIDWSIPCHSIFLTKEEGRAVGVKRPLAPATMRRIARGVKKFVIDNPRPYIVEVGRVGDWGEERAPFVVRTAHGDQDKNGKKRGKGEHSIAEPLPTVLASGDFGLVSPTLIQTGYGERKGQAPRVPGLDKPLGTLVGGVKHALVAAFLAKHYTGVDGAQLDMPMPTVTSIDHNALVTAHLAKQYGTTTGSSMDEPVHTVTGGGTHISLVASFLLSYFEHQQTGNLFEPVPTILSKDRFALVTVNSVEYVIADIGMRMLVPRELYRAQGFPESYKIDIKVQRSTTKWVSLTKTAQVRMVGNSVCPPLACAIVRSVFGRVATDDERMAA